MDFGHEFERRLAASWPPTAWHDRTVLVAVSGGADSVALLRGLCAIRMSGPGRLVVAHANHQLRGEQSNADQAFVVELAERLKLPCELAGLPVVEQASAMGDGMESAARELRYAFFREAAGRIGARYVVTAHTADDQAETVLHRVLRGTGLAGLAGIPRARSLGEAATLLRPLLGLRRSDVESYLTFLGQTCRQDETNLDLCFTRNRLRHDLLPKLAAEYNPQVVDSLVRLGSLAGEAQRVIEGSVARLRSRSVTQLGPEAIVLERGPLRDEPAYLVRELLIAVWREAGWPQQQMGFAEWNELTALLLESEEPRVRTFPGRITARREAGRLALSGDQ